jgi:hypothetical protein
MQSELKKVKAQYESLDDDFLDGDVRLPEPENDIEYRKCLNPLIF